MVVSINPEPDKAQFEELLARTLMSLKIESDKSRAQYLSLLGTKLEDEVVRVLSNNAIGTPFEGSIEKISGQRFPDIVAKMFYGVEVKTTKSNQWKSVGSSVAEGTRVENVERIYMLFGKMSSPIDFMCRPYEQCLSEVVVTHSPRYLIDMNLKQGETIFDKIQIPYDELRNMTDPINVVLDYYRKQMDGANVSTWWSPKGHEVGARVLVRLWNQLSKDEKSLIRAKGFCLFPEVLGNNRFNKYNRFSIWLSTRESVVCHNIRDIFSAGGQERFEFENNVYLLPRIIMELINSIDKIKEILSSIDILELEEYWPHFGYEQGNYSCWKNLVSRNYGGQVGDFPLVRYLATI